MNCLNLSVIPQFGGTCWFNAILMIALYSQLTRKIVIKSSKTWDKTNKFLMILKAIVIKYYNKPEKVQKFFNKIKPELILFKMIKTYKDYDLIAAYKNQLKKNIANLGWIDNYIIKFFRYLNLKCMDITYYNDTYLINFDKITSIINNNGLINLTLNKNNLDINKLIKETQDELKEIPDIIVVFHNETNKFVSTNYINFYLSLTEDEKKVFNPIKNQYLFQASGIATYDEFIYINNICYKLDATTLTNYNIGNTAHAISGITCKNNHYVYNGWNQQSTDPAFQNKGVTKTTPCSLMKYDWNLKKDDSFCLNPITCKLDFLQPNQYADLCFSFAKGLRTLIYVRVDNNDNDKSFIKSKINVNLDISNRSELIKDIHDFKNLTNEDIINQLAKFDVYLVPNIYYERAVLESLLYDELKKYYNINSSYKTDSINNKTSSIKIDKSILINKKNSSNVKIDKSIPINKKNSSNVKIDKSVYNYDKLIKLKKNDLIKIAVLKNPNINYIYKTKPVIIGIILGEQPIKKEKKIKETKLDLIIKVKAKYSKIKGLAKLNKKQLADLL